SIKTSHRHRLIFLDSMGDCVLIMFRCVMLIHAKYNSLKFRVFVFDPPGVLRPLTAGRNWHRILLRHGGNRRAASRAARAAGRPEEGGPLWVGLETAVRTPDSCPGAVFAESGEPWRWPLPPVLP